ncbi:glycine--tRNA ligase subunit beta [Moraxella nasicaprae]|uniref:Glycine--tRNA ligase beta subunit n=1 Tax=Moraxella nasicaprae TaxID=2904122 RepID=A0ABY6F6C5_9GAMM|nr:glycine--tRNA ligase subunit beta [Moraxella nasicaprae]UXZ05647.1 glycine--tRNA ligase subunit beta [Moraxella nasicaprae]
MNTILFELGTEELPPKSLKTLRDALLDNVRTALDASGIVYENIRAYAAPRRLAVQMDNVATTTPDKVEQKRGPALKAAFDDNGELTRAGQGFLQGLNATGLTLSKDDLITVSDKKGEYIGYDLTIKGEAVDVLLPAIFQKALDNLPIAKRMRSGADRHEFVRPVQWVVLMRDEAVIDATIQGHKTGNQTRGHRYHAPDFVSIAHADDYQELLKNQYVIADFDERQASISKQVARLADEVGADAIVPDELLDEVTALVDFPVALRASFEERFLAVPQEALISTMQADQKYFCLTDKNGKLLPYFVFVSNIDSLDKSAVILGNEKVVRPRLADAEFFFLQDQKQPLSYFAQLLKNRVFQDKLGTIWQKSERIAKIATAINQSLANQDGWQNINDEDVVRAAMLCKADLATTLVGEFPELQGVAGTYYAKNSENPAVAQAIEEQYLPKFSGDNLPQTAIGTALALADRIDTLVGIFGIGQVPTGSKDPFSLRRASIGILRILIEKKLPIGLSSLVQASLSAYGEVLDNHQKIFEEVMTFINSRYRAMYTEQGVNVDTILAVQEINPDTPFDFDERIRAVEAFRALPQAKTLAQNNKRVGNILAKAQGDIADEIERSLLVEAAEQALFSAVSTAKQAVAPRQAMSDYQGVLQELVQLDEPLTQFFDGVMVNADDENLKNNRLALLQQVRALFLSVADIGLLQS